MKAPTNYSPDSFNYYGAPYSLDEIELDYTTRAGLHTEKMMDEMWRQYDHTARVYRAHCRRLKLIEFIIGLLLGFALIVIIRSL